MELISYEAISTKYYEHLSYSCIGYPASKIHLFCTILYWQLWPVRFYHIFSHIISQPAPFTGKKVDTEHQLCVLIFSTTFVW